MPTRGKKDPNGRALRGRRAYTTFISDPIAQIWSNYNVRSGAAGAATPEQPAVQNCLYDRFEALYKKSSIKPSLVIVPARFKSGTLYSEIPTSGAGDFTVTRASGGVTRVNASGLIESAKTNLVLRSEEFDNASWIKSNLTVTTGSTSAFTAPDGNLTAQALTLTLVSGGHTCSQFLRWPSGTLAVGSVYVKPDTATKFFIANGSLGVGVFFNLSNGTIEGTIGAMSGTISAVGNGYYRITAAHTATASQTFQLGIYQTFVSGDYISTAQFTPSSANLLYVWGAQLEEGSSASEYIPTTTVARTRFAGVTVDGTSPSGIPRLDYFASGGTVGCPALLVEPSGSNLFLQSAGFQVSGNWGNGLATVTTGSTAAFTAPDNSTDADLITATAAGFSYIDQNITIASGTYTISVFAKAGNYGLFRIGNVASASRAAWFNLNAGAVTGTVNGGTASMQNYGNGWYRCIYTSSGMVSGSTFFAPSNAPNSNIAVSGSSIYFWGAQLETGSVATSYIPTTTGSITRNADVVSVSGAVSGSIGQTEGTIYCEFAYFGRPAIQSGPIFLRQGNLRGLSIGTAGVTNINFTSRNDGGTSAIAIVTGSLQLNTYYKVAIAYDAGGTAAGGSQASGVVAYVNGVQTAIGTFRVPDAAGLTEFRMYGAPAASADNDPFNGRIRAAALYTTRLTNEQLAFITQP